MDALATEAICCYSEVFERLEGEHEVGRNVVARCPFSC
jgi:hypothetical protein